RLSRGSTVLATRIEKCVERRYRIKLKSTAACSFSHGHYIDYHFYAPEWNSLTNSPSSYDQLAGETRERLANIPQPHNQYIEMWQRRYDYLPTHETFLTSELATYLDYMDWFRHYKSYLLPASKKEGNVTVGGQDECPSILGRDIETQRDRHLLHLY
ncbi:hypothetical protein Godav_021136, partial [Gossypium davidsonii]|nr:hypothetical protein [Gossypium davidsonii]